MTAGGLYENHQLINPETNCREAASFNLPDEANQRLTVRVHRSARPAVDRTLEKLFKNLNEFETTFPSTELVMYYELLGSTDPKQKNGVNESSQR
ncbi:MAG: hypothetical protein GVY36_08080 [Verrucomicrobia bacterium]|nr:hypothetical protein [Verrucomicrobiota bacterium]